MYAFDHSHSGRLHLPVYVGLFSGIRQEGRHTVASFLFFILSSPPLCGPCLMFYRGEDLAGRLPRR